MSDVEPTSQKQRLASCIDAGVKKASMDLGSTGMTCRGSLSSRAVAKKKQTKDPIRALLADLQPAMFMGNPTGTVAIMQDKVVDAGGDPDEVLAWVREHGGFPDKSFSATKRHGLSPKPQAPTKQFYVIPEDALK